MTESTGQEPREKESELSMGADPSAHESKRFNKRNLLKAAGVIGLAAAAATVLWVRPHFDDNESKPTREPGKEASALPSPSPEKQEDTFQFISEDGKMWHCTIEEPPHIVIEGENLSEIVEKNQTPQTKGKGVLQDEIDGVADYNIRVRKTFKNRHELGIGDVVSLFHECDYPPGSTKSAQPTPAG